MVLKPGNFSWRCGGSQPFVKKHTVSQKVKLLGNLGQQGHVKHQKSNIQPKLHIIIHTFCEE